MAATFIEQLRVLVVEDNPVNRLYAARLVERQGHVVHVVSNGQLALEAVRNEAFDVVLMDIGMPVMDGFEAVCELRRLEQHTKDHLPVIAMTANATPLDRERCLAVGMDDFVCKPVQAAELAAAFGRVFQKNPSSHTDIGNVANVVPEALPSKICDLTAALKRIDGDEAFLKQLAQLFLDIVPGQLQSLETSIQGRNREQIGDMAHSVKGSVRHFFAAAAYGAAERLEITSQTADPETLDQMCTELLSEVRQLQTELQRRLFSICEVSANSGVS